MTKRKKQEHDLPVTGMPGPVIKMPKAVEDELAAGGKDIDPDAIEKKAAKKGGKDAAEKAIELLEQLRALGYPVQWPTRFRPHLCCARKAKNEELRSEHGVEFRRDGADCMVEATNRIVSVRFRLEGEGEHAPTRGIVPAKAMKLMAAADDDLAAIWFPGEKVAILVDDEIHQYRCIPPDLPFPTGEIGRTAERRMVKLAVNAEQLALMQQAMGSDHLEVCCPKKSILHVQPSYIEEGNVEAWGFLQLMTNDADGDLA